MAASDKLHRHFDLLNQYFDFKYLVLNCTRIHYFGLGFIQIKLDWAHRVHVYTPELESIVPIESVHNHRYTFESAVLSGHFEQEIWDVDASSGGPFMLEDDSCQEGYKSEKQYRCSMRLNSRHTYSPGDRYLLSHETFHRTLPSKAITLLTRNEYSKAVAQVVRSVDSDKVCPYSKKISEADLWDIVKKEMSE